MSEQPPATRGFGLGRVFGARVIVQPSTLVMLVILALLFSTNEASLPTSRAFAFGLLLAVLLFASVFVHECAHAVTARLFKREVREIVLTLWGGHTSFDARDMTPAVNGVTAIAGPAANVVLAGLAQLAAGATTGATHVVLGWLAWANLLLAIFNALPGIPMDGGRVLESVVWAATGRRHLATKVAAWGGRVVVVVVVALIVVPALLRGEVPRIFDLVWAGLIAMILWPAASAALRVANTLDRRDKVSVETLMVSAIAAPFDVSVADAIDAAHAAQAREVVVIAADGASAGHFPVELAEQVPVDDRATTSLQSVTMPMPRGAEIPRSDTSSELVPALREWWGRTDVWVVRDDEGGVIGIVKLVDAIQALQ